VVLTDLTIEQAHLLKIALNNIRLIRQELLARLLKELQEVPDIDLSLSGLRMMN